MFYRFKISYWIFPSILPLCQEDLEFWKKGRAITSHTVVMTGILLAFAKDREQYRRRLLEVKEIYDVSVLNYMVARDDVVQDHQSESLPGFKQPVLPPSSIAGKLQ